MEEVFRTTLLEGDRTNLIPDNAGELLKRSGVAATFSRPSLVGDIPTWEVKVRPGKQVKISLPAPSFPSGRDYTFSIFCWRVDEPSLALRIGLSGAGEKSYRYFTATAAAQRFEVSHRFGQVPETLTALIESAPNWTPIRDLRFFIACPVLEQALFASSPIEPGMHRSADLLSFPRAGKFFEGASGSLSIAFIPSWSGFELSPTAMPCFVSCVSDDARNAVALYADGTQQGRLCSLLRANGVDAVIESAVIPLRGHVHAITLRWSGGIADLFVDGWPAGSASGALFPNPSLLGDQVHIGCEPKAVQSGVFAGILGFTSYRRWLDDRELRHELFSQYPTAFPEFRNALHSRPDEALTHLSTTAWCFPIVRHVLRFPDVWQQLPPPWLKEEKSTDEANFRDEITRSLAAADFSVAPEAHAVQGRTDLVVQDGENRIRFEFKVWGRHDFADVPRKPLKYFTGNDQVGAVLMINANKGTDIGETYRQNVLNSGSDCVGIIDLPFGETLPDHFASLHQSSAGRIAEILHVVFDKHGPFGV